jgi:hypothetical protein
VIADAAFDQIGGFVLLVVGLLVAFSPALARFIDRHR